MQTSAALFATALTLALPGPTNALLAIAGTEVGFRRAAPLALVAVLGYGIAVFGVAMAVVPLVDAVPMAGRVLRLVAAAILVKVALGLWTAGGREAALVDGGRAPVGWSAVFGTTLLNPKSLVLAMLVMPDAAEAGLMPGLIVFALPLLIAGAALGWIGIGAVVGARTRSAAGKGRVERCGAVFLSSFAAVIMLSAFH